jgi:hypothetical protein
VCSTFAANRTHTMSLETILEAAAEATELPIEDIELAFED